MEANRRAILALEALNSGATTYLHKKCGLVNFFRYPTLHLARQFRLLNSLKPHHNQAPTLPQLTKQSQLNGYILCHCDLADHNLTLANICFTHAHELEHLGKNYAQFFIEAHTHRQHLDYATDLTKLLGQTDLVIVSAHCDGQSWDLDNEEKNLNNKKYLISRLKFGNYLKQAGQLILNFSSANDPSIIDKQINLAAHLSTLLPKITVFVPHVATPTVKLNLTLTDAKINADPSFTLATNLDINQRRVYQNGHLISGDQKIDYRHYPYRHNLTANERTSAILQFALINAHRLSDPKSSAALAAQFAADKLSSPLAKLSELTAHEQATLVNFMLSSEIINDRDKALELFAIILPQLKKLSPDDHFNAYQSLLNNTFDQASFLRFAPIFTLGLAPEDLKSHQTLLDLIAHHQNDQTIDDQFLETFGTITFKEQIIFLRFFNHDPAHEHLSDLVWSLDFPCRIHKTN
jgi:hypothetical protein